MVEIAVIPIGGYGTRFLPATKAIPKEMLPVYNKPLIQHVFEEAKDAGISKFIFITGRNKHVVSNHFDHNFELEQIFQNYNQYDTKELISSWIPKPGNISYIRQQKSLGLGHAILCAQSFVNEPFAILLPDEIFIGKVNATKELITCFNNRGNNFVGIKKTPKEMISNYGVISYNKVSGKLTDDCYLVNNMVEKPPMNSAPSDFAIIGRYILQPEIFDYLNKCKEKNTEGEIQLTDAIAMMIKDGSQKVYAKNIKSKRFDCGYPLGLLKANIHFALKDKTQSEQLKQFIKDIKEE